jgi:hypothetical protein
MKKLLFLIGIISLLFYTNRLNAQNYSGSWTGLPLLFYGPETGLGYGAAMVHTARFNDKDTLCFPSQVQFIGAYTQKNQILLFAPFNIYRNQNKHQFKGELGYYRYLYYYFGIGPYEGTSDFEETYDVNFPRIKLDAMQQFKKNQFIGFRYALDAFNITRLDSSKSIYNDNIVGSQGGTVSGIGPIYQYDNRNHSFIPNAGTRSIIYFQAFHNVTGSHYNYMLIGTEISHFQKLGKGVLATQAFMDLSIGAVPFYQLPNMGGPKRMRGYYPGQIRAKNVIGLQAEYRTPIFLWERISAVAFAANGYDFSKSIVIEKMRFAAGAGLRVLVDKEEGVNIRVDYGIGQNSSALYITIGESF